MTTWYLFRMAKWVQGWKGTPSAVLMDTYDNYRDGYNTQKDFDKVSSPRDNYTIMLFPGETEEEARQKALEMSKEMCK